MPKPTPRTSWERLVACDDPTTLDGLLPRGAVGDRGRLRAGLAALARCTAALAPVLERCGPAPPTTTTGPRRARPARPPRRRRAPTQKAARWAPRAQRSRRPRASGGAPATPSRPSTTTRPTPRPSKARPTTTSSSTTRPTTAGAPSTRPTASWPVWKSTSVSVLHAATQTNAPYI